MSILDAKKTNPLDGGPSFALKNRIIRGAWNMTWLALASWTPPFAHPWRRLLLRAFGAKIEGKSDVRGSARVWYPPNLHMEPNCIIADRAICYNMAQVTMRKGAIVSQGAHLCGGSHDICDPDFQLITGSIELKENSWVAAEAFVGPNVIIGKNTVLGARGVAFKSLDDNYVYAGNPAKKIKART